VYGYAWPVNLPNPLIGPPMQPCQWHHLAYCYDGAQERIYVDGQLVISRSGTGLVGNATSGSVASVGAILRTEGFVQPGFRGLIDTLRISSVPRYVGTAFVPPLGDLPADTSTLLLYSFNEPAGSMSIADSSGLGRNGELGVGFSGATSPTLGCKPGICLHPQDALICPTGATTLTSPAVDPRGDAPIVFQWQIEAIGTPGVWMDVTDGPLVVDGRSLGSVTGASAVTMRFEAMTLGAGRPFATPIRFRCTVSNSCGTTLGIPARVVICRADFNCTGTTSIQDVFDFLSAYFTVPQDLQADFNGDNGVTVQDLFDFIAAYFAGC
jgi:hypothetical protein